MYSFPEYINLHRHFHPSHMHPILFSLVSVVILRNEESKSHSIVYKQKGIMEKAVLEGTSSPPHVSADIILDP